MLIKTSTFICKGVAYTLSEMKQTCIIIIICVGLTSHAVETPGGRIYGGEDEEEAIWQVIF